MNMNTQTKPIHSNPAFTMIELIFVIIVLGILAALAIPRLERDIRQEAGDNILSAIRYTKHMALIDDKMDPRNTDWQKTLWAIRFTVSSTDPDGTFYTIATDMNRNGAISKNEAAVNPADGRYFYNTSGSFTSRDANETTDIFIGHNYGISNITFAGGCANYQHIAFDHFGRPHVGITGAGNDYSTYMTQDCTISVSFVDNSIDDLNITIEKQTGHAYIVGQPNS